MKNMLRNASVMVTLLASGLVLKAAPLEAVYDLDVDNPEVLVAALDKLFESDDMAGHTVSLWAAEFNGNDPGSHVVVAEFDDFESYEKRTESRRGSPDWLKYVSTTQDASELTGSSLVIQRMIDGGGWRTHGALAAFIMTVTDPTTYAAEFAKLIDGSENPGSIRLMQVRAGGMGTTHIVLITAPTFSELNEFLDGLPANSSYISFIAAVTPIRTIQTVSMYRRIKSWED